VVTVELYGVPRLRAGRAEVVVSGGTVAEVLTRLQRECPGLAGLLDNDNRLSPHYLLSLDGVRFFGDTAQTVPPGSRLLLLSADAGG
jgi:molybdopterin synthase sulfur carrier subunit